MKTILIFTLLLLAMGANAQSGINDLANEPTRQYMKNIFVESHYRDLAKALKKGEVNPQELNIKSVGLLTFSIFEQDYKKDKALITYQYEKEGQSIVERLYDQSLDGINDSLRKHSIQLVTPQDFTSQQLKHYREAMQAIREMSFRKIDLYERLDATNLSNTPAGIAFAPVFMDHGNSVNINDILGTLCSNLGLDALLSVQVTTNYFNYSIAFTNALMMLTIPTPNAKTRGQKLASYFYMTQSPVGFVGLNKGAITGDDLSGFPILLSRMTGDFFNMISMEQEMLLSN